MVRPASRIVVLAAAVLCAREAAAQTEPRPKPLSGQGSRAKGAAPAVRPLPGVLLIQLDAAGQVTVDGNGAGKTTSAQDLLRVAVSIGQHIVQATSIQESTASVQQLVDVKSEGQHVVML